MRRADEDRDTLEEVLAHPQIAALVRVLERSPGARLSAREQARRAAVLLMLRVHGGQVELLLIKRATYEGDPWSGHVALPGGRQEPGDVTLERTALRETLEEIGVDVAQSGRVIGRLDELQPRTPTLPPFVIAPFVAVVANEGELRTSDEVATAFWAPLEALRDPGSWRDVELMIGSGRRVVTSVQYLEHTIWGLTERILRQLFSLLDASARSNGD
jgi:8-oxo-dGTP pyrophosphatase MutT (NUDIX family)